MPRRPFNLLNFIEFIEFKNLRLDLRTFKGTTLKPDPAIFRDDADYIVFLNLLKRYLGDKPSKNPVGVTYPLYHSRIELLAFCLMSNHFRLLVYQHSEDSMKLLFKSVSVAYAMYFNKKYKRIGPVFQQRYRASRISNEAYLLHISRYIHLNPDEYNIWQWSSLPYYSAKYKASWVIPKRILDLFDNDDYLQFVDDYKDQRDELDDIRHELANDLDAE